MGSNPSPAFANLARDAYKGDMAALFEAREAVEGLLRHPGWAHVSKLVALEADGIGATLDGRLLDSRAEYARLTGRRGGLRGFEHAAHAIVAEAARKMAEQQRKHEPTAGEE